MHKREKNSLHQNLFNSQLHNSAQRLLYCKSCKSSKICAFWLFWFSTTKLFHTRSHGELNLMKITWTFQPQINAISHKFRIYLDSQTKARLAFYIWWCGVWHTRMNLWKEFSLSSFLLKHNSHFFRKNTKWKLHNLMFFASSRIFSIRI